MLLSASQAAKQVGKSVPTITRAIKNGKLSATKTDDGGYQIDPAELFRVWPAAKSDATQETGNATPSVLGGATHKNNDVTGALEAEVQLLKRLLDDREATISDLREDRDQWRQQAQTLLLTNQAQTSSPAPDRPRGLLELIFGRKDKSPG